MSTLSLDESALPYDRTKVTAGIVHFSVGQFCRAHLFHYTHHLLALSAREEHQYDDWGIIGVNVRSGKAKEQMAADFERQRGLYTVTLFPTTGEPQTEVIGSMLRYLHAPDQMADVLDALSSPATRIVSLTVTEGGYNLDETTGRFAVDEAGVQADLQSPREPRTVFGLIVEGLRRRREAGTPPYAVLSCDNLRHNGRVARTAVLGYAAALDADLAAWIAEAVPFPNSMVDRITPATTPEVRARLQELTGLPDAQPVIGEDFTQWVLEDGAWPRPPWERVGAELTADVTSYEQTKVRVLNSSHLLLSFAGLLLGYRTVHEALADPDLAALVRQALQRDVLPTLQSPMDGETYAERVLGRFANAAIADQLPRIAGDGCSKVQVFWTDTVRAVLQQDHDPRTFAFCLACFIEYLRGHDDAGATYPVDEPKLDPSWPQLLASDDLAAPLGLNAFDAWRDLPHAALDRAVVDMRREIREKGVRAAMPIPRATAVSTKV